MTGYFWTMGGALCACTIWHALRLRRTTRRALATALLTAVLAVLLGTVLAKVVYVLAKAPQQFSRFGMNAFLRSNPEEFSIFGGCLGVCLAAFSAAKLCRVPASASMDCFAPGAALLFTAARAGEYFLGPRFLGHGMIGLGDDLMDNSWNCFFPLAVQDHYEMWFQAVFMLEALIALIAVVLALTLLRRGHTLVRTAYFLMAAQIYTEMLHNQTIAWGFVRVEQLLCAITMMIVLICFCARTQRVTHAGIRCFWPCGVMLLMCGIDVGVEFALDKSYLPPVPCYLIMLFTIVVMLFLEVRARQAADAAQHAAA